MARQVLPWVGAAVGFWLGGPAGAQFGFAIGGLVGNAVDPQVINGPKLGEGQDTTAAEGAYRPIVLGKGKVGTCIINQGPLIKRTIRHKQSKGGGPVTTEERFYRTMAFAVGEPADVETGVQLLRMWVDGKLVYDVTPTSQIVADSQEFAEKFTFYTGTMGQLPDPDLEAYMGAGNVSAYQGAPYIVFPHYDVTQAGGRAPLIHVELASNVDSPAPMFITGSSSGSSSAWGLQKSPDGHDWMGPLQSVGPASTHLLASSSRVLMYNDSLMSYTDDDGASFTDVENPPGSSAAGYKGIYFDNKFWIPCGLNGYATSENGVDWSAKSVRGGASSYTICATDSVMVMAGLYANVGGVLCNTRFSANLGASWSENIIGLRRRDDVNIGATVTASGTDREMIVVGGHAHSMAYTINGATWFQINSPFVNGPGGSSTQTIRTIRYGKDRSGVGLWVAVSGSNTGGVLGQTALSRNGRDWFLLSTPFGSNVTDMEYANRRFVAISAGSVIKELTDISTGWVPLSNAWTGSWNLSSITCYPFNAVEAGKVPLSSIVAWTHDRVNIPASKYDVTELSDAVEGLVYADGYTAADAIRTSGGWYFFDAGEFDAGMGYRLHYVKRGRAAVATLTDQDIVEGPEDWEREDSYERPRVLHVAYQNPVMDYGAPTIPIKRTSPDVLVVGERSLSVPFVHSDQDEVARRGDIAMTVAYTEIAGKYEVVLPVDWLSLTPTDTIGFSIRGRTRRLRMTSWRYSPDGTIKTEWMADRQSAYTSNLTALPPIPTTPPPPSIVGPTVSAVLDIPALTDGLDSLHLILAASGQTPAWWGAIHQRRLEAETDFSTAMVFSPPTTIMGVLQDDVSEASPHYTDTTSIVRVRLYSDDELDTHTQQQFLSENGAFALSWDDGGVQRWEVLQYRDAVKVGEQEWELYTLARGRLDTAVVSHPAGSMFVLLDAGVRATPAQVAWIGQEIEHRAVSNGQQPDQATPYTEEYTGQSQREWPVAHLSGEIDGDDLRLTCIPRHRFGTDDNPVQSINHDGYRWTATDGSNSATADTAAPSHTFDVTGWTAPITVTVAQLNRITGDGPYVSETIDA